MFPCVLAKAVVESKKFGGGRGLNALRKLAANKIRIRSKEPWKPLIWKLWERKSRRILKDLDGVEIVSDTASPSKGSRHG